MNDRSHTSVVITPLAPDDVGALFSTRLGYSVSCGLCRPYPPRRNIFGRGALLEPFNTGGDDEYLWIHYEQDLRREQNSRRTGFGARVDQRRCVCATIGS